MDFITDMFVNAKEAIDLTIGSIALLPARIDSITFTDNNAVTTFFGMLHYVMGTPLYSLLCVTLLIGMGFIMYHIAKMILNILAQFIPKLRGRFILP